MTSKTSTIRIGRYHNTSFPSVYSNFKLQLNLFVLLNDLPPEHEIVTSQKVQGYCFDIPPLHLIDWKKGILDGKSWADEVGA